MKAAAMVRDISAARSSSRVSVVLTGWHSVVSQTAAHGVMAVTLARPHTVAMEIFRLAACRSSTSPRQAGRLTCVVVAIGRIIVVRGIAGFIIVRPWDMVSCRPDHLVIARRP